MEKFPLDSNDLLGIFLIFSFHSQISLSKYLASTYLLYIENKHSAKI